LSGSSPPSTKGQANLSPVVVITTTGDDVTGGIRLQLKGGWSSLPGNELD